MAKWMLLRKGADFKSIMDACGISVFLARLIRNRDIVGVEASQNYLFGSMADLRSPLELHGMREAASLLGGCIREGKKIRVIGDYDVDGICSAYILWRMLQYLGADADAVLPDRERDGYGLNESLVDRAAADGVRVILTCDNGIAAVSATQHAREEGITTIVTDHHEIPYDLVEGRKVYHFPAADAVVDPMEIDDKTGKTYSTFPQICGAEVAFKLVQVMLGCPELPKSEPESFESACRSNQSLQLLADLLPFCALATVCDVMPLIDENRTLVRYGLNAMQECRNVGLQALLTAAGIAGTKISAYHAGFIIGPCLNASGRLNSAELSLHLFMEQNEAAALRTAKDLKDLNESRKSMTEEGVKQAVSLIESGKVSGKVLVVPLPDCHPSVAGIIAGRLREKYDHPVFVISMAGDGTAKGSGRSIEQYDMFSGMSEVSDVFLKFGGHKMAAGLTIDPDRIGEFTRRINENCGLTEEDFISTIRIDMELPLQYVTEDLVHEIGRMEPYGTANVKPLFAARNVALRVTHIYGKNGNVIKILGRDASGTYDMVLFRNREDTEDLLTGEHLCSIVYWPEINVYRGRSSLQYVIRDYKITQ